MKSVSLCFFGPARNFSPESRVVLAIPEGATVQVLRQALRQWLAEQSLGDTCHSILARSVFATAEKILSEDETIVEGVEYIVIPPISGG